MEKEGATLRSNMFARQQMAKMLGMEESTLAKMLNKQEILKKLPGGEALMKLTGDELRAGLVTAGAAAADIAAIMKDQDTRDTKDIMDMMYDTMTSTGIKVITVGKSYATEAKNVRESAKGVMTTSADMLTTTAQGAYGVNLAAASTQTVRDFATAVGSVLKTGVQMLTSGKAVTKANPLPTFNVDTGGSGMLPDFVSFPSTNRILSAGKDSFRIHDDDLIVGGTGLFNKGTATSNNNGNMDMFAQAVVTAIDRQTRELKADRVFGPGLTNSYYG